MTRIMFLDTACLAFPRKSDPWEPHCARIAAVVEEDGEAIGGMLHLLKPKEGWFQDPDAVPYHRAGPDDFRHGVPASTVAPEFATLIEGVQLTVAFNAPFHRRMVNALFADGEKAEPPAFAMIDAMSESAPICRLKLISAGRWKSPKLIEAYRYFGGMGEMDAPEWDKFASQQLSAVRAVYRGIRTRSDPKWALRN